MLSRNGAHREDSHLKSKIGNMIETLSQGEEVCKLRKALYGLRQAGRLWHAKISHMLMEIGMDPANADPCVHVGSSPNECMYFLLYVDDILIGSRNPKRDKEIKERLGKEFEVNDIGKVNYCLGIEVHQSSRKVTLSQRRFMKRILTRFGMVDCKPVRTTDGSRRKTEVSLAVDKTEQFPYRELIGALMYLSVGTRPDIAHAVNYLNQFNNCHNVRNWKSAKRVLRISRERPTRD